MIWPTLRTAVLCATLLASAIVVCAQGPETRAPQAEPVIESPPFGEWLDTLLTEARERGYSDALLKETLVNVEPLPPVIQSDRTQAELTITFDRYLKSHVTPAAIRRGRENARLHRDLLVRIERTYGVPRRIVLAVWGMESGYGRAIGRTPIFQALSTLAWEPRRSSFFRAQLFDALTIVSRGYIDAASMKGSWAGAMGQTQFMPSSYLEHAVDFDGDGRRDIWASTADALASTANYLKAYGWKPDQTWGREVRVPAAAKARIAAAVPMRSAGCYAMRNMTERLPLARWRELGVTLANGGRLPRADLKAGLVQAGDRQFLVYENYDALLGYNCAHHYALSVALLGERLR